jgi:hypothetical protein
MSHSYPSDISRKQFARILPTLESARRRTKPRTVDLYDVFCGVLYFLKKAGASGECCLRTSPIGALVTSISGNGASSPTRSRIPFWNKS